jgi:hypothetical protein
MWAPISRVVRAPVNLRCQSVGYQIDGSELLIIQGK